MEAVDKRNPSLVRAARVAAVEEYRVKVHLDGWDDIYDDWFDADSTDLHPVGWCEKTGHPLETPLSECRLYHHLIVFPSLRGGGRRLQIVIFFACRYSKLTTKDSKESVSDSTKW